MSDLKEKLDNLSFTLDNKQDIPEPEPQIRGAKPTTLTVDDVQDKKLYHIFYSTIDSCRTVTPAGRSISFVGGKFITDVQDDIDYLNAEIAQHNPFFKVKAGEEVVEADDLDPMKKLRKQFFKEFEAEQAALAAKIASGDLPKSESEAQKVIPASTSDVGDTAAGSNSQ